MEKQTSLADMQNRIILYTAADGKDYFDELLEKILEIRASERRACQKITDEYPSI